MTRINTACRYAAWVWLAVLGSSVAAGGQPVADAAKAGDWGTVRALVERGADVNAPQGTARPPCIGPATGMMPRRSMS